MKTYRPPVWFPASNYYVLAIAFSAAAFFVIWGVMHDEGDDSPWITAGISASVLAAGSVVLRALIVRRGSARYAHPQIPYQDRIGPDRGKGDRASSKLTIERNLAVLAEVKRKSDAAKVLDRLSAGHREVVDLCSEYTRRVEDELKVITPESPRLPALLKGRTAVQEVHHHHLLRWAEIESQQLVTRSRSIDDPERRLAAAWDAVGIIDSALRAYPIEDALLATRALLEENVIFVTVAGHVDKAEKAVFTGDLARARELYCEALYVLGRDSVESEARINAGQRIRNELQKIGENIEDAH